MANQATRSNQLSRCSTRPAMIWTPSTSKATNHSITPRAFPLMSSTQAKFLQAVATNLTRGIASSKTLWWRSTLSKYRGSSQGDRRWTTLLWRQLNVKYKVWSHPSKNVSRPKLSTKWVNLLYAKSTSCKCCSRKLNAKTSQSRSRKKSLTATWRGKGFTLRMRTLISWKFCSRACSSRQRNKGIKNHLLKIWASMKLSKRSSKKLNLLSWSQKR